METQIDAPSVEFFRARNISTKSILRRALRAIEVNTAAVAVADRVAPVGVSVPEISAARCGLGQYFETVDEFNAYIEARRAARRGDSL